MAGRNKEGRRHSSDGLTGAHPQDIHHPMIAPRRPPSSRPFLAAPRIDFYHPARAIEAALHGIERAIRRSEGIGLVVGPPGTGKTLLLAKLAEHVRDDFDVALLSGARICTRRALWQSILAEIGEPYRGIDEGELRIGVVERVRGLASTGSGLVILVDEAHTLPTRLLEELRLLTNIPTPLPAVHVVLAGTTEMEERLGLARLESLAQRIGARFYLEALDHAETIAYLRTQMKVAGLQWDATFGRGSDDAVFAATDGVPRLVNQLCDLALVQAGEAGRKRIDALHVAAAWRDIQRLPAPGIGDDHGPGDGMASSAAAGGHAVDLGGEVVEFGEWDAVERSSPDAGRQEGGGDLHDSFVDGWGDGFTEGGEGGTEPADGGRDPSRGDAAPPARFRADAGSGLRGMVSGENPWSGPEIEIVFDGGDDPFAEYFAPEIGGAVERCVMRGPDDFAARRHVASREGAALARRLPDLPSAGLPESRADDDAPHGPPAGASGPAEDDSDMLVIEEDLWIPPPRDGAWRATPVRNDDYRRLFARMRRGDGRE